VLARNPYFRQWSAAAQPTGFPDRIVINTGFPLPTEIRAVETGKADALWDFPTPAQYAQLEATYPNQTYVDLLPDTSYFFLNTHIPPFNSLDVRQAVNFAVDRHALLQGAPINQTGGGKSTCQVLPPDYPGYAAYCPYTLDPGGGNWTAPDLAKAEALIAKSGMKGTRVTVWTEPGVVPQAAVIVETLRSLGFVASDRIFAGNNYGSELANSRNRIQAGFYGWESDYISPAQFFEPLLSCSSFQPDSNGNLNLGGFCDRAVDRAIARATAAQLANSGAAADWAAVDRLVVDEAPWISVANPETIDFVSRRVGDFQYNPQFGELADLLWVQ
jgi:peptide/nickel transport system substrate-binding protein